VSAHKAITFTSEEPQPVELSDRTVTEFHVAVRRGAELTLRLYLDLHSDRPPLGEWSGIGAGFSHTSKPHLVLPSLYAPLTAAPGNHSPIEVVIDLTLAP
jgi:hypothetical protein